MEKINFENGTLISKAKVLINGTIYEVEPAQYEGSTPLSAQILNEMQGNIETAIEEVQTNTNDKLNNINTYSTEETKVGTWIDGKPIYRKVFTLPNISSSNKQLVNSSVPVEVSYDKITKITGIATIPDGILPIPYMIGPEQFVTCFLESNQNKIFVYCRSYTTMDIKIFLEYTKTTD